MMFLIAEYCSANFYTGWWLYSRDTNDGRRNADGEWGWLRRGGDGSAQSRVRDLLCSMGFSPPESRDHSQVLAEWFAANFPNGLEVECSEYGEYRLLQIVADRPRQRRAAIRTIRGARMADLRRCKPKILKEHEALK